MTVISRVWVIALAVAAVASLLAPRLSIAHPSVDVVASNWKFTPSTITLHVGEPTQVRFMSSEGVHGIQSSDLGIPLTTIMPGSFTSVSVTPKKAGTYVLHCAIICGAGHPKMTLTVKVEDGGK